MIRVERNIGPPQSIVDDANAEHNAAAAYYADHEEEENIPTFHHVVFSQPDVREALEILFNGKCAYCESKVMVTSAIDKEHFRPKAKIVDEENGVNKKPGYYWLAADWDNLLLSCPHCNRTGTFKTIDGVEFVSGKLNHFPLSDETRRLKYGGDFEAEEEVRLLINPCVDHPESYFEYDDLGMIFPNPECTLHNHKKADKSITIYGLHRGELCSARRESYLGIQFVLNTLIQNVEDFTLNNGDDSYLVRIISARNELERMMQDSSEYLGIKRYFVLPKLEELKVRILQWTE